MLTIRVVAMSRRLGRPWWPGIAALLAATAAAFFFVPDALLLLAGLAVPLGGGALFAYRRHSFWWAVVAVVAAWLLVAVVTTLRDGWDAGPAQDVFSAVFFSVFLAGATLVGGLLGKHLTSPPSSP